MPNKFVNILDIGGIDNNKLPEKISDRNCSYANAIDFSTQGMISAIGSSSNTLGITDSSAGGGTNGDMFLFKKSFGKYKELLVRSHYNGTQMKLEWFNENGLINSGKGQWELITTANFDADAKWGAASTNGDGGEAVNRLVLGNGVNDTLIWDGSVVRLLSVTSTTIRGLHNLSAQGFSLSNYTADANGDYHILVNGRDFTFTGISGNDFTGVIDVLGEGTPDVLLAAGKIKVGDGITTVANSRLLKEAIVSNRNLSFTLNVGGNYITRDDVGGDFEADGFGVGQRISVSGFSDADNNGIFTIKTVGTTQITLVEDNPGASNEAKGGLVTLSTGVPKGNIFLASQGKLFLSGVVGNESKVYYSVTGDVTNFGISTGLGSGGSFTLLDGGGYITALVEGNSNTIIIHKNNAIISYARTIDSSSNVIETFNNLVTGYGLGAINNNCITTYGKQQYFLNGNGEIKVMQQSLYSSTLFDFSDIAQSIKNFLSDAVSSYSGQYLVYNADKKCLIISTPYMGVSGVAKNHLVYVYIKQGENGYIYDSSIEKIELTSVIQNIPLVFINYGSYENSLIVFFPSTENVYSWMGNNTQTASNGKAIYMTKELTFGEPAQDKEFDIINIDGFIYGDTVIKITVLYGAFNTVDNKNYFINKNSECVDDVIIKNKDYGLLGDYSMPFLSKNYLIKESRYFKLPLHIDVKKSDRFRIRIETWGVATGTWWAVNNISINATLKDVNMNNLLNQNEVSLDGVGVMAIGTTNTVA